MSSDAAPGQNSIGTRKRQNLVAIAELSTEQICDLIDQALMIKQDYKLGRRPPLLQGRILGMLFEKPSLRTRVSFEVGMYQLGGHAMYLSPQEVELGRRESVPDAARVLSRYVDAIVIRTFGHDRVQELARHASIPVINGLSDLEHPCQALADILTIREHRGTLPGVRLTYIGDGNNVCNSLALAATKLGLRMTIACPRGYEPPEAIVHMALEAAHHTGGQLHISHDPREAVRGADVVYTDVWTSMGQERESAQRRADFAGFQLNRALLNVAGDAVVMHCLPAHRGEEITDEVMESDDSIVFDQAENRVHAQKAVLCHLIR